MSTQLKFKRGNKATADAFTGAQAELYIDTDTYNIRVHDGSTAGGFQAALNSDLSNVRNYAQSAYAKANTGGTFTGSVTVQQDLAVSGNVAVTKDLSVTGNLYVTGNTVSVGSQNIVIDDSMIYIANNNPANLLDIGVVGHFTSGTYQHTGLVRDHTNGAWRLFSNVATEPSGQTLDFTNANYDTLIAGQLTGNVASQFVTINGIDVASVQSTQNTNITAVNNYAAGAYALANTNSTNISIIQGVDLTQNTNITATNNFAAGAYTQANGANGLAGGAFTKANGAVQTAFVTVTANTTSLSPASNNDTLTITGTSANGINIYAGAKTVGVGLVASGVTPGSYGGTNNLVSATVDTFGRLTSLSSLATTNITQLGTIGTGTWNGTIIGSTYGGTGVNNGSSTITLGGNLTTSGAFPITLTATGSTSVTLPTSGTLVNSAVTTLSSLNSVGTIGTGTWNGTIIGSTYGGTGVNNGSSTITLGGNLTTSGAFGLTLTTTALTNVTLPTSGTLVNTAVTSLSSLATVGTITSGVWNGSSISTTYTDAKVTAVTAGTGVSVSATTGSVAVSIGQAVATTSTVQFAALGVGTAPSATTGEIRATNNITAYYSDRRLKDIKHTIPNALDKVLTLSGVIFTQNKKAEEFGYNNYDEQVGVIAQEVQAVLPQVVKPAPFDLDENNQSKSGENYITVQYEKLVPLLIEAIKEQQKQIDELKAKVGN